MSQRHLNELETYGGLQQGARVLDIGCGNGEFVAAAARAGYRVAGIEVHPKKVERARRLTEESGHAVDVRQGVAEQLPYESDSFEYINMSEVTEHVQDVERVLAEACRVLAPGGKMYVSAHNRFGLYDYHFHLYGLGWMPRAWAQRYVAFRSRDKDYGSFPDRQRIDQMLYFCYGTFARLLNKAGFDAEDLREQKIAHRFGWAAPLVRIAYRFAYRPFVANTFHVLAVKREAHAPTKRG